jgi:hypothetical protein
LFGFFFASFFFAVFLLFVFECISLFCILVAYLLENIFWTAYSVFMITFSLLI